VFSDDNAAETATELVAGVGETAAESRMTEAQAIG